MADFDEQMAEVNAEAKSIYDAMVPQTKVEENREAPPTTSSTLEPIDMHALDEQGDEMIRRSQLPEVPGIPEAENRKSNLMNALGAVGNHVKRIIPEPGQLPELPFDPTGQMDGIMRQGTLDYVNLEVNNAKALRLGGSSMDEYVKTKLAQPEDFKFLEDSMMEAWSGSVNDMFPGKEAEAIRQFLNAKGQMFIQGPMGALEAITPETVGDAIVMATTDVLFGVWEASGMTAKGLMEFVSAMKVGQKKYAKQAIVTKLRNQRASATRLIDPQADVDRWADQLQFDFKNSGKLDAETVLATASLRRALSSGNVMLMMKTAPRAFIRAMGQLGVSERTKIGLRIKSARLRIAKRAGIDVNKVDLTKVSIEEAGLVKRILKREQIIDKNSAGILARYFKEVRSVMNKQGPHGAEIMRRMDANDTAGKEFAAELSVRVQGAIDDLNPDEMRQLVDLTDPNRHSLNITETSRATQRAFKKLKKALEKIQTRMKLAGPDSGLLDEFDQPLVNAHTLLAHIYDLDNPATRRKMQAQIISKAERESLSDPTWGVNNGIETVTGGFGKGMTVAEKESLKFRQVDQANEVINKFIAQTREKRSMAFENSQDFTAKWQLSGDLYQSDPKQVFREVIDSYARRVSEFEHFGSSDGGIRGSKIQLLINRMREEGFDARFAGDIFDQHMMGKAIPSGADLRESSKFLRGARAVNVVTKLSLAQMRNATQFVNTGVATNMKTTAKAMLEVRQSWGHDRLSKIADELIGKSMHDAMQGAGLDTMQSAYRVGGDDVAVGLGERLTRFAEKGAEKTLEWTGFTAVETFNRRVAFQAGRRYLEETVVELAKNTVVMKQMMAKNASGSVREALAKQIDTAHRQLRMLDIPQKAIDDMANGKRIHDKWRVRAGHTVIKDAQFETTVKDLPAFWSSDYGKFFTQFKSFSFRHAHFMKKHAFDEALEHNNWQPLTEFMAWGGAVGFTQQSLIDYVRGKDKDEILFYEALKTKRGIDQIIADEGISGLASKAGLKKVGEIGHVAMRSYLGIGSAGIFFEMITDLLPEIFRGGDFHFARPAEIAFGPSTGLLNDAAQITRGGASALNIALPESMKIDRSQAQRAVLKNIPVLGPAAAAIFARPKRKGQGHSALQGTKRRLFNSDE